MDFTNETDYKELFLIKCKECDELKGTLKDKEAQNKTLADMIAKMEKETADLEDKLDSTLGRVARLDGMVDAFKYCVRNYMAGGGE